MALVDRERMKDATGAVHLYRPVPNSTPGKVPAHPHPDATHDVTWSGWGLHPCKHTHETVQDYLDWCEAEGREPDHPISGDQTARWRYLQCWDDVIGRTRAKFYSGAEPCENPECPHPKPHCAGQWFSDRWPRFRDIAHALYPGGVVPVPVDDLPKDEDPVQLDLIDYLAQI